MTPDQPPPTRGPASQPVYGAVRFLEAYEQQREKGLRRYGTPLTSWNGRRALTDALQELADAVAYVTQAEQERADLEAAGERMALLLDVGLTVFDGWQQDVVAAATADALAAWRALVPARESGETDG